VPTLIPFLFLLACQETSSTETVPGSLPTGGESFATVNDVPLSQNTIDAIMSRIPASKKEELLAQGVLTQMKEQLITTELIYQKAIEEKLHESKENKITMALAQREVLVNAYIQKKLDERLTDTKLQDEYNNRLVQYQKSEADLSMIIVADESLSNSLKSQIDGGADFSELAKTHSEDAKSKETGGNMGMLNMQQLPPMLKDPVSKAKDGEVVGPINLMGKFAIIKVNKLLTSVTPFEEVKDALKGTLSKNESQLIVEELKSTAKIEQEVEEKKEEATEIKPAEKSAEKAPAKKEEAPAEKPAEKPVETK
jgi:peptidyl-prolyl cis-trans isomerase C